MFGAIYGSGSSPTLTNCMFSGNTAIWDGGGLCTAGGSSPTLANCTFSDNNVVWGEYGGGGMSNWGGFPTLTNCILWGNSAPVFSEVFNDEAGGGACTVSYSDVGQVGGFTDGGGNVYADPLFADAANGDLRLWAGSPCIDSADGDAAPATDIDGNARYDDPDTPNTGAGAIAYADMGAHELQEQPPVTPFGGGCASGATGVGLALFVLVSYLVLGRRRRLASGSGRRI